MYILTSSADMYLAPSLEFISCKLKLPESLAGVTLLAFGNGAPDVFTAISANADSGGDNSKANPDDTLLSFCTLVGATVFLSSVVQIFVARQAKKDGI